MSEAQKPNRWLRALSDPKVAASLAAVVIGWSAILLYMPRTTPEMSKDERAEVRQERESLIQTAIIGTATLLATALAAMGYEAGKMNENTAPAGRVVIGTGGGTIIAPDEATARNIAAGTGGTLGTGERMSNAPRPGNVVRSFGIATLLLITATGCAGTSPIFKRAAPTPVNLLSKDLYAYNAAATFDANGDGTTDDAEQAAKADERGVIDAFKASVATYKGTTLPGVQSSWSILDPRFRVYVVEDATLPTPDDKAMRTDTADSLNRLIDQESARQRSILDWIPGMRRR